MATAEEKLAEIEKTVVETEGTPLTPLDELNIIENKGIEYILHAPGKPPLPVYVAPIKIGQYRPLEEMMVPVPGEKLVDKMERYSEKMAPMLGVSKEVLLEYLDADDVMMLRGLLTSTLYQGKRIFMKKKMKISEDQTMLAMLGRIPNPVAGSPTTSSSSSEKES